MTAPATLDLVCPAGTPAALRAAVDAGADVVYCGFRDDTNARNFPGLNFDRDEMAAGIAYAHDRGCGLYVTVNTYAAAGDPGPWRRAVDDAVALGADALIMADMGLLAYAAESHPDARLHLSVQASAANAEAIRFHRDRFGIRRVVLPRVLTLAEIAALNAAIPVETEVFAFGGMCVMAEGRCALSGYAAGQGPNRHGVCSPAGQVRFEERGDKLISRLGAFTIDIRDADAPAGYPTLCKGCFAAEGRRGYLFEDPVSLDAMALLPDLMAAGVAALKIEGRQRGRAYVAQVVGAFRAAVDAVARGEAPPPLALAALTEGGRDTTGAFAKGWR